MRKFGIKYSELHPYGPEVREAFIKVKKPEEVGALLAEWYDPAGNWPESKRKTGPGDLIAAGAGL